MGKDQELLEAARKGNTAVVEKILGQRAKRSGPLARWVIISCQNYLISWLYFGFYKYSFYYIILITAYFIKILIGIAVK